MVLTVQSGFLLYLLAGDVVLMHMEGLLSTVLSSAFFSSTAALSFSFSSSASLTLFSEPCHHLVAGADLDAALVDAGLGVSDSLQWERAAAHVSHNTSHQFQRKTGKPNLHASRSQRKPTCPKQSLPPPEASC